MRFIRAFALMLLMLLVSCVPQPQEAPPELYWPFPPERPRIKFVDYLMGSLDVTGTRPNKFTQALFGERKDVRFLKPAYVAVKDNVVYVTDVMNVHVYDFNKKDFRQYGGGVLRNATGIDVASDGTMYVGDSLMKKVVVISPGDQVSFIGSSDIFESPGGIAVDEPRERFLVADAKKHDVKVFSLKGEHLFTIGRRGLEAGMFNFPYDVDVDEEGNIYVMDSGNFRVQILDPEGKFITSFGAVGTAYGHFARPKGIAVDSEGYIYVVDAAFGNFQIFDAAGQIYLAVGENGLEPGRFLLPLDVGISEEDKIYIVDQMNQRVQIFERIKYEDEKEYKPPRPSEVLF